MVQRLRVAPRGPFDLEVAIGVAHVVDDLGREGVQFGL
eukprot:CAMPEP_0119495710 /NCGR_PEP_ID=MMETSP1344-20130328/19254_1 /TAXON_ID=236787 /ORGANISM="Florenciella parvula, Strain CCMP2471" /LENGTH=37 /DNA_ID= /DNA_START= /DNA_END= /DNA_ORIENTATION=